MLTHHRHGLALMLDFLCAVLYGEAFGPAITGIPSSLSEQVSHFFGAIKIDRFRNSKEFCCDMDKMLREQKHCQPAEGEERVFVAG